MFFRKKKRTLKLGLALGSGGAKGFAELGALFAFEQAGLEFDAVAGTSIGSIIGAFYCAGYSATDIAELLKRVDVSEIKNRFMIQMDTMGLFSVIDNSIGNLDIEELKKPFAAVATEQKTGKETVFFKGSVAKALCASSSYPPFFKPVIVDGTEYVDGAFVNSVPADVVDHEKGILLAQMAEDPKMANKPEKVKEGIIVGKINKYYKEVCLLEQAFVKDDSMNVAKYVDSVAKEIGAAIKCTGFTRFAKGEGLQKKEENFADEIAKMVN